LIPQGEGKKSGKYYPKDGHDSYTNSSRDTTTEPRLSEKQLSIAKRHCVSLNTTMNKQHNGL